MFDLATSHDCNGQLNKRKRNSLPEAPVDGRLENTTSSEVGDSFPKKKRMRLWDYPNAKDAVLPVNKDTKMVGTSKEESNKHDRKTKSLNSHLQPVKETSIAKDEALSAKSQNAKPRRTSQKLTVRMKFMPTFIRNLKADSLKSRSSSQSQTCGGICLAADSTAAVQTSNGEASPTLSTCKLVRKPNGPRGKKHQSEHCSLIAPKTSPARSPASNRKHDLVLLQQNAASADESIDIQWIPPQSPFNLVEESLFHSSWKILVASIILENGQGWLFSNISLCIHTYIYLTTKGRLASDMLQ